MCPLTRRRRRHFTAQPLIKQSLKKLPTVHSHYQTMPAVKYRSRVQDRTGRCREIELSVMLSADEYEALSFQESDSHSIAMDKVRGQGKQAILSAGPWLCVECCRRPAVDVHQLSMIGFFQDGSKGIKDFTMPHCGSTSCVEAIVPSMQASLVQKARRQEGIFKNATSFNVTGDCEFCKKYSTDLSTCSRCKAVFYCSRACQKTHWKTGGHKQECRPPS